MLALLTAAFINSSNLIMYPRIESILSWLKRLKDIDWQKKPRQITEVVLELEGVFGAAARYRLLNTEDGVISSASGYIQKDAPCLQDERNADEIRDSLKKIHFEYWLASYPQEGEWYVMEGGQWNVSVTYDDGTVLKSRGDNTYPENWDILLSVFRIAN